MTFAKSTTFEYTISSATCWWSRLSTLYFEIEEFRSRCGALTYTMTREDGSPLPSWIEWDDQILEFDEDTTHLRKLVIKSNFMPKDEPRQFTLVLTLNFDAPRYRPNEPYFLEKLFFRVNILSEEVCANNAASSIMEFLSTETFTMTGAEDDITKEFVPQDDDLSDKPTVRINRNFSKTSLNAFELIGRSLYSTFTDGDVGRILMVYDKSFDCLPFDFKVTVSDSCLTLTYDYTLMFESSNAPCSEEVSVSDDQPMLNFNETALNVTETTNSTFNFTEAFS